MNTICIKCPMGCPLTVEEKDGQISVIGNTCKRGAIYGAEEYTHPQRSVTTLVKIRNGGVASVKTSSTVPKEKIFDVVAYIGALVADENVRIGDKIANDVLGLGVDVVITGRN